MVGIDIYPGNPAPYNFTTIYGSFIDAFSTKYNKPFVIGETGAGDTSSSTFTNRTAFLKTLSGYDGEASKYPTYLGFSWFEYNKEADFRVVMGNQSIATNILKT